MIDGLPNYKLNQLREYLKENMDIKHTWTTQQQIYRDYPVERAAKGGQTTTEI